MPNDQEFEVFLRRFQPLAPAPLPRKPRKGSRNALWLAAAMLLLATGLWLRQRPAPHTIPTATAKLTPVPATWGALSAVAVADPAALDAALEGQARQALPDVGRRDGALRSLAAVQKDL
jgi:hypothetical protein